MIAAEHNGVVFTAKELTGKINAEGQCSHCVFSMEPYRSCVAACKEAVAATLPDCDDLSPLGFPVVYVRTTKGDPRQLDCAGPVQISEAS